MADRVTILDLLARKREGKRFTMVTAYDAIQAALVDEAGVEAILVGDSAANVIHGHETTLPVTMDEMVVHVRAAARGRKRALLVADMPFLSYQPSIEDAIRNAGRFLKEGLADAVKLEGGAEWAETTRALVRAGIPVMAHVGLTPQWVNVFGGYKVQGRDPRGGDDIAASARALEAAGAFAVVLECVPASLAARITRELAIPTIGIGAGADCDAQVLVFHDLLGFTRRGRRLPRFVKRYEALGDRAVAALKAFRGEVESGAFPAPEHAYEAEAAAPPKPAGAAPSPKNGQGAAAAAPGGAAEAVEPYPVVRAEERGASARAPGP
jgi:3-methyl-2-oxobutanoate hydroxymethyltransferase